MELPQFIPVRQELAQDALTDVAGEVRRRLREARLAERIKPGFRVAITAGSRGINNIAMIVGAIAGELRSLGAQPFIVPAMGSHGGATAEGQREVLAEYGITEESMGCPVLSDMEPVYLGVTPSGVPAFMDRNAFYADAVIVAARVKPHTSFRAPIESGLCKMMAVGLGKQRGAEAIHSFGLGPVIAEIAQLTLATGKIAMGLAIVENTAEETCRIEAVPPEQILEKDRELLLVAAGLLPRIPFDPLDVLIVDWMGKNFSGTGMDTNIIGLWRRIEGAERKPYFKRLVVLNLTPESGGNAVAIGLADFTTRKLFEQINFKKTYMNALTANVPQVAKIPIILDSDREAIEVALKSSEPQGEPRVVRIRNTLHLMEYWISPGLLKEAREVPGLQIAGPAEPLQFDPSGNLL